MTAKYSAGSMNQRLPGPELVRLGDISPSWLANQLDARGMVRLQDALPHEWLDSMRKDVLRWVDDHGDGDLFVAQPDREIGSPAHQLMSDPALIGLLSGTAGLRRPRPSHGQKFQCSITVRNGVAPKMRSNLFHYDPCVLTIVVPIVIPSGAVGARGELAAFGNKRPFRRFVIAHVVETVLTHNALYRRHLLRKVKRAPETYIVDLEPGDAYAFWGYRQFHGNLVCAPGLLRATLVLSFGEVHADSRLLKLAWKFSRSRRDVGRLLRSSATSPDTSSGLAGSSGRAPES